MKFVISLMFLFKVTLILSQNNNCDSIPWTKSVKLSWSDFKATPDTTIEFAAISNIHIKYQIKRINDTAVIKTFCFFNPCLAWSKFKNSDILLMHEQGHFNIAEYFRRLFIKRILVSQFNRQDVNDVIKKIYSNTLSEYDLFDKQYDIGTDFSKNRKKQIYWTQYSLSLLNLLKDFDKQEISLTLLK